MAVCPALVRPGEVDDGNLEEGVARWGVSEGYFLMAMKGGNVPAVLETGEGIVPRHESSQEAEESGSFLESKLSGMVTHIVGVVLGSEQQETDVEEEEEEEECKGGSQCADEKKGCEDEPASQEETHNRASITLVGSISTENVPGGCLEKTVSDPETSV